MSHLHVQHYSLQIFHIGKLLCCVFIDVQLKGLYNFIITTYEVQGLPSIEPQEKAYITAFTGHRTIAKNKFPLLTNALHKTINTLIGKGVTTYITGGALGFDTLAATAVLQARKVNPGIRLLLALPCTDQDAAWHENDKNTYRHILANADETIYVSNRPHFKGCMELRNRYLIEHSGSLIAYMTRKRSGSAQTVRLAHEKGLTVINLAEMEADTVR